MNSPSTTEHIITENTDNRRPTYETPAIVYEGVISTRAGSPLFHDSDLEDGVDPADLFND